MTVIRSLMNDPYPDGRTKIALPFPFPYGSIGHRAGGFFITYEFENAATIRILAIGWANPDYYA